MAKGAGISHPQLRAYRDNPVLSAPVARASGRAGCCHGALVIKLPLRNGQENGLRPRGLVHPEHALCLAELCPDEMVHATGFEPAAFALEARRSSD